MRLLVLLLCFALVGIISCKKDSQLADTNSPNQHQTPLAYSPSQMPQTVFDTLHPCCWIPAYPGSYWTYSDGSTINATGYELDHEYTASIQCIPDVQYFVPQYDGYSLFCNRRLAFTSYCYSHAIVFDSTGQSDGYGSQYQTFMYECITIDTSLVLNGVYYDSVQVVGYLVTQGSPYPYPSQGDYYQAKFYKKNIGLIGTGMSHPDSSEYYDIVSLTQYSINWP